MATSVGTDGRSGETVQGQIASAKGIGRDVIVEFLKDVPSISRKSVEQDLAHATWGSVSNRGPEDGFREVILRKSHCTKPSSLFFSPLLSERRFLSLVPLLTLRLVLKPQLELGERRVRLRGRTDRRSPVSSAANPRKQPSVQAKPPRNPKRIFSQESGRYP